MPCSAAPPCQELGREFDKTSEVWPLRRNTIRWYKSLVKGMQEKARAGRLVAVVVTFNRLAQLEVTVARLLQATPDALEKLIVINNASTDDTKAWLAAQTDARLVIHDSSKNLGGAGGFEIGMRLAAERFDPDWILVMDDDARPAPDALAVFQSHPRDGAIAWAAAAYFPGGGICDMNRPSLNPFWDGAVLRRTLAGGGRDGFHLGPAEYNATQSCDVDGASFVGLFVSRAAVALVGYPDGRLFLYGDDVLYTLGLRRAGGRILFDPQICFEHDFATMSDADPRFRPLWKTYYHYRNLLLVYRLSSGPWFFFLLPAIALKWLLKLRYYTGERRVFVGLVFRALRDGVLHRLSVSHETVLSWAPPKPK